MAIPKDKLPVSLLTGFLGSGKTLLLNHLLREPGFANTAVIVNEFGEIGLDHVLVQPGADNVVLPEQVAGLRARLAGLNPSAEIFESRLGSAALAAFQSSKQVLQKTVPAFSPAHQHAHDANRHDAHVRAHCFVVKDGRIAGLLAPGEPAGERIPEQSARGLHVFPGLIDAHVHFGLSGEKITEYATETAHAAQRGFTTVLGYFLNNEAYTEVFAREQEYARTRAHVDYGFHFSTANELHIQELERYVKDYGVTSFKYFMNFKGDEGRYLGLDGTDDGYFYDLLKEAARIGRVTIVCHTENIELVNRIRHLSTRMALDEVRRWRGRYGEVLVETCPHYLTHDENSQLGPIGKANPPFRSADDVQAMWQGLADGAIDVVGSDHVPRKRAAKDKGLWQASQGFPGTATILPVLLSEGYHKGRLSLARVCDVVTAAPARIFNLEPRKGRIAVGADADLTLVDLAKERVVKAGELGSYADYSLYDGWKLKGWPVKTIVRGATVMEDGRIVGAPGYGKYLFRKLDLGVT